MTLGEAFQHVIDPAASSLAQRNVAAGVLAAEIERQKRHYPGRPPADLDDAGQKLLLALVKRTGPNPGDPQTDEQVAAYLRRALSNNSSPRRRGGRARETSLDDSEQALQIADGFELPSRLDFTDVQFDGAKKVLRLSFLAFDMMVDELASNRRYTDGGDYFRRIVREMCEIADGDLDPEVCLVRHMTEARLDPKSSAQRRTMQNRLAACRSRYLAALERELDRKVEAGSFRKTVNGVPMEHVHKALSMRLESLRQR